MLEDTINVTKLQKLLREFARVRDWEKFHNPKNLVMAASVEAAELVEIFQWLTEAESALIKDNTELKEQVSHEIADIMLYLLRLCDILDIKLASTIDSKFKINEAKYPAGKVKGNAKKYNQYSG